METVNWLNWLVAVAGLWQLVSPFILNFTARTTAMWNAVVIGLVLIVLGVWAALNKEARTSRTLDWVNAILGLWLVASPFVLGYSDMATAMWSSIIVGLVVLVFAGWAAFTAGKNVGVQA